MRKINLILILFLFVFQAFGQKVLLISKDDRQAIPGVVISTTNKNIHISTNSKGEANLARLQLSDSSILIFQHNYFKQRHIPYSSLDSMGFVVKMEPSTIVLGAFSITANKWEHNRHEIPFEIEEVSAKEIEFDNPQTAADLIGNTGKVFIQKSQMGGGSPMIRGFAANGVLIVVDGVRMNNAIFRSGNLQNIINIDPNIVGHAEVIFGPGSVTYGSDAMGGVMDFHTKKAEYAIDKKFSTNVELMGRASSVNNEQTYSLGLNLASKSFASRTQFSYSKFNDLKAGKQHFGNYPDFGKRTHIVAQDNQGRDQMYQFPDTYVLNPSHYEALFFDQKFSLRTGKNSNLSYQFLYSTTSDIPRYDRLTQWKGNHLKYAEWYYGPQEWMMHNIQFRSNHKTKLFDEIQLVVAYQQFGESRHDRKYQDSLFRHRNERVNAYTLNIDFEKNLNKKWDAFYGIEVVYNDVKSTAKAENIFTQIESTVSSRYPGIYNHYTTGGLFLNLKYSINKKLTAMGGLRYSRVYSDSKFDTSLNHLPYEQLTMNMGAPNGSLGIAWLPGNKWQINFNIASAFRAPNIDDAAKIFDSEPGHVVVPNPNLSPEYAYSAELGIKKDIKEIAHLELNAFYTYVDQIIVRRDFQYNGLDSIIYDGSMSKVQAMVNGQSAQIYGVTAAVRLKITKHFDFETTYSLMHGEDDEGYTLRHIPPSFGNSSINFTYKRFKAQFYANYNGGIAFDQLAPSEQSKTNMYSPDGAEAWYTLNFKGSVKIDLINIELGVENILDRFYMPYSSGIPGPGRNYYISFHLHI
jgi:hemoglobin/transferrin/lactoferrin receptor protein